MNRRYNKTVNGQNFVIVRDYFGNWSIYNAMPNFDLVVGCPPFSVGHRTKKAAIAFLEDFMD